MLFRSTIKNILKTIYSKEKNPENYYDEDDTKILSRDAKMICDFFVGMKINDYIISSGADEKRNTIYSIGQITSQQKYIKYAVIDQSKIDDGYPNYRSVKWIWVINREDLSEKSKNILAKRTPIVYEIKGKIKKEVINKIHECNTENI